MKNTQIFLYLKRYLSFVLCLFAIYMGCYVVITHFVFGNYNLPITYISYIFVISLITSLILLIILRINKLSFIGQIVLIYITITISIYFVGFLTKCFKNDATFWISSLVINLIGLVILLLVMLIKNYLENKKLNDTLKDYKEKIKKWKRYWWF